MVLVRKKPFNSEYFNGISVYSIFNKFILPSLLSFQGLLFWQSHLSRLLCQRFSSLDIVNTVIEDEYLALAEAF